MKRFLLFPLLLCLLWGCAPKNTACEVNVFAASSLTEALTEIAELYRVEHPDVHILFNFDSSGTLKQQIEAGADCDLFLSASPKQMDALTAADAATRRDLLENKVVLCVAAGNPKRITSFDELAERLPQEELLLAIGNKDVPVGQYTQKLFAYYGLEEAQLADRLTYGSNVKEVTAQISEGAADCGIVYATDALTAKLTVVDIATAAQCGQVVYPAAVLTTADSPAEAKAFLDYLSTPDAAAVFEQIGFTMME